MTIAPEMSGRSYFVPDVVIPHLRVTSKTEALQVLAQYGADITGVSQSAIVDALLKRERLGTTGIGDGIAIPHCRLPTIERPFGLFARLETAIDFEADDERNVDLIFVLLAPKGADANHLTALARVSRLLRDRSIRDTLRRGRSESDLLALLSGKIDR